MVRVNLLPPNSLTNEHLFAERVEILMLLSFIDKHPKGNIPDKYCLGKGHMSFFRDKKDYLIDRYCRLMVEIKQRQGKQLIYNTSKIPLWHPSMEEININKERIIERLRQPKKKRNKWHYYNFTINNIEEFINEKYQTGYQDFKYL